MTLTRKLAAEAAGTAFLCAAVIGSGVMAERLAGGNAALALLANTLATGAALFALISSFAETSGAHFNPVVSLVEAAAGRMSGREAALYSLAQVAGALAGAASAHVMFELPLFSLSTHARSGTGLLAGEIVATIGLLAVILGSSRSRASSTPAAVACYIVAAYWFTSSTSFANPALTLARSLSDTFAGILPADAPWFVAAQLAGAAIGAGLLSWLWEDDSADATASLEAAEHA